MAREASETPLTPEGDTVTTKFTKKLHTLHMLYRSPDSLWSTKDKLEAVVLVIAPDTKMDAVVNFVSQMELFFPKQQQYTRDTLDPLEVRRLEKGLEGPFSSIKVKTSTVTRTGSQSRSTTSTLDNTKFELGDLEVGTDELGGTVGKKAAWCVPKARFGLMFPCYTGPRSRAMKAATVILAFIVILAVIAVALLVVRPWGSGDDDDSYSYVSRPPPPPSPSLPPSPPPPASPPPALFCDTTCVYFLRGAI